MKKLNKIAKKYSLIVSIFSFFLGIGITAIFDHYIFPLYLTPHAHLRVSHDSSNVYVDNINGKAPIDWIKVTITATNGIIERTTMTGTSPFDISDNQFSTDHKSYFFIVNHMSPEDWGQVHLEIGGDPEFTVEVSSSSDFILGDTVSVFPTPEHGVWGSTESYGDWLKEHPNYKP